MGTSNSRQLADITPQNDAFNVTVDAQSVYSLTTTTGQRKGRATPPPPASFPLEYQEDFAGYTPVPRRDTGRTSRACLKWSGEVTARARP